MIPTYQEIVSVVGEEAAVAWSQLDEVRLYTSPDNQPYGLLGTLRVADIVRIAACVRNPADSFTNGMIRDVMKLIKTENVVIATDHPDYHDHMRKVLSRYNMKYEVIGDILYSRNF